VALLNGTWQTRVQVEGGVELPEQRRGVFANAVSPGWFATYGTPILAGRDFSERDVAGASDVAIVNQAFARRFLSGANPIGRRLLRNGGIKSQLPLEIVGLAADAVYRSMRDPVPPTMYIPLAQRPTEIFRESETVLSVRAAGTTPALLTRSVAAAIGDVNRDLVLNFRTLADSVNGALIQERLVAILSGFFGGLALLLAGLGLYGVTSYAVSRRRTEIGIRLALGAAPAGVVRLVLVRVAALVASGILVGALASLWAARFVETLLFGLTARDTATLVGAILVLAAVGALAGWIPAFRASRIDPAQVLRDS
jgi:predicted permease